MEFCWEILQKRICLTINGDASAMLKMENRQRCFQHIPFQGGREVVAKKTAARKAPAKKKVAAKKKTVAKKVPAKKKAAVKKTPAKKKK